MIGRRGFITGLVAVVAAPLLFALVVLSNGSLTGDHFLSYDRRGTWACLIPADHMSQVCTLIVPFVPVSKLDEVAPEKGGFIGCENGVPTIRNITINGLDIPEGKFLIDGTAIVCKGEDI